MNWKREAEQKLRNYAACRRALTAIPLMIEENRYRREGVRSARVDGRAVSGGTNGREEMLVLILDRFYIHPARGNAGRLCEELCMERANVYRRKDQALRRFTMALYGWEEV